MVRAATLSASVASNVFVYVFISILVVYRSLQFVRALPMGKGYAGVENFNGEIA
jgi:hypothetical protein